MVRNMCLWSDTNKYHCEKSVLQCSQLPCDRKLGCVMVHTSQDVCVSRHVWKVHCACQRFT